MVDERVDPVAAQVHVEDGAVEHLAFGQRKRLGQFAGGPDHAAAHVAEQLLDHHGDDRLVLDQQYLQAVQRHSVGHGTKTSRDQATMSQGAAAGLPHSAYRRYLIPRL